MSVAHGQTELDRLRTAYFALARHLRDDHSDDRVGNGSQQHVWHRRHHGLPNGADSPHPLPRAEQDTP